jgi:hypothetical protein
MIEEPGVSNVGSAAHRYAGLPIRSVTSTVRRPTGIVEHSVGTLGPPPTQPPVIGLLGLKRFSHQLFPRYNGCGRVRLLRGRRDRQMKWSGWYA